jgi:rare lipoprotein A
MILMPPHGAAAGPLSVPAAPAASRGRMNRFALRRFACRAVLPGIAWLTVWLAAGCSSSGEAVTGPLDAPPASGSAREPARAAPLPGDARLPERPALAPRPGLTPPPERPAFTPHWYTPRVDPLFRRSALPPVREGAPHQDEATARAEREAPEPAAPAGPAATSRGHAAPAPARRSGSPEGSVKDFDAVAPLLEGIASWYGPGFHGKRTASGEIYDQRRLTAAHPTLPLGTIIRVEHTTNGRVVWVRVNDRGPYKKGRVLDLSRAAAERLGMVDDGTAPVRISVLRWPSSTDNELGLRAYSQYVVQVAAYPEPEKAEEVLERMQARFVDVEFMLDLRPGGVLSVVAGPFDEQSDAQRLAQRMQRSGVTSLVRRYRK